jgi:hypothetical protein
MERIGRLDRCATNVKSNFVFVCPEQPIRTELSPEESCGAVYPTWPRRHEIAVNSGGDDGSDVFHADTPHKLTTSTFCFKGYSRW